MKPFYYDLKIKTEFDSQTEPNNFDGEITIKFACIEITNSIVLHKSNININESSIKVFDQSSGKLNVVSILYDEETEIFNVTLSELFLKNQNYSFFMTYVGNLDAEGFFKSSYTISNGTRK